MMILFPVGFHPSPILPRVVVDKIPAQSLASDEAGEATGAPLPVAASNCEGFALRTIVEHCGATRVGLEDQKLCC